MSSRHKHSNKLLLASGATVGASVAAGYIVGKHYTQKALLKDAKQQQDLLEAEQQRKNALEDAKQQQDLLEDEQQRKNALEGVKREKKSKCDRILKSILVLTRALSETSEISSKYFETKTLVDSLRIEFNDLQC